MAKQKINSTQIIGKSAIIGSTAGVALGPNNTTYVGLAEVQASAYLVPVPCSGTIKNLCVWTPSAPGAGQTFINTLMVNNVAQSLTCTISGAGSNGAVDNTNTVTVAANDRISLRVARSASATSMALAWCVEYDIT